LPTRWLEKSTLYEVNANSALPIPAPTINDVEGDGPAFIHRPKVFQPFSFGPRDCVGKGLAMLEMRLILAKLVWNFDLIPLDKPFEWGIQKTYFLWEKKPINVGLKARE
jgi:cytochrome P450